MSMESIVNCVNRLQSVCFFYLLGRRLCAVFAVLLTLLTTAILRI